VKTVTFCVKCRLFAIQICKYNIASNANLIKDSFLFQGKHMARIGDNLRKIRKERQLTLEQVALPAGTDTGNLSRIERGLQGASEDLLNVLADVLGVHPSRLLQDADVLSPAPVLREFKNVPIVGAVQGGDNGFLTEIDYPTGYGDGHLTYPAKDNNTYALKVKGDSMRPRIKNNEFIIIEPNHQPQPGDDVIVCTRDGRKMVKELLYIRDGEVTLRSVNNDHNDITLKLTEVEKLHYVAAIVPRGAFYKN
jgi:SOS-response transcriptional repressor LexA